MFQVTRTIKKELDASEFQFFKIFCDLAENGKLVSPRGQLVVEIENYTYELPPNVRFQSYKCRKFNLQYVKDEMLWYLKGDRFDVSIAEKAKLWQGIINEDGSINSNYGQYLFYGDDNQFDNVVRILASDKDSRRASMMILSKSHLLSDTKDYPCTYAINFRIRDGKLNMSVHMRSQDAVFGMGSDAPAFSFIHEMMLNALKRSYPDIECGNYHHIADSFHAYERHFELLEKITGINPITKECVDPWTPPVYDKIECPAISGPDEVDFLRKLDFSNIHDEFKFTKWLINKV